MELYIAYAFIISFLVLVGASIYSDLRNEMWRPLTAHEASVLNELQHAFAAGIPTQDWGTSIIVGACGVNVSSRLRHELRKLKEQEDLKKPQLQLEALREEVDRLLLIEVVNFKR